LSRLAAQTENAVVPRESPIRPLWLTPRFAYLVLAGNAVVILGFWWFSSGFEITHSASDLFNGVGRVTGLLGAYLALWQLLLMARLPWLERAFGLEWMAVLHRWNGYLVLGLLVGHGVFQTLGYQLGDGKNVAAQLADRTLSRTYLAVVRGRPTAASGVPNSAGRVAVQAARSSGDRHE